VGKNCSAGNGIVADYHKVARFFRGGRIAEALGTAYEGTVSDAKMIVGPKAVRVFFSAFSL